MPPEWPRWPNRYHASREQSPVHHPVHRATPAARAPAASPARQPAAASPLASLTSAIVPLPTRPRRDSNIASCWHWCVLLPVLRIASYATNRESSASDAPALIGQGASARARTVETAC